mmetsp:Transcript_21179/g.46117  ORF Transcript_21179/g.46117 Transcript_21179/m.46117 type:complete len:288 (+) Transcript_21179:1495-2358(+)
MLELCQLEDERTRELRTQLRALRRMRRPIILRLLDEIPANDVVQLRSEGCLVKPRVEHQLPVKAIEDHLLLLALAARALDVELHEARDDRLHHRVPRLVERGLVVGVDAALVADLRVAANLRGALNNPHARVLGVRLELVHHVVLARAALAKHEDRAARAKRVKHRHRRPKLRQLGRPSLVHHRDGLLLLPHDPQRLVHWDLVLLALEFLWLKHFVLDDTASQLVRGAVRQDPQVVLGGVAHEPGAQVDDVAHHGVLATRRRADDAAKGVARGNADGAREVGRVPCM